MGKGRRPGRPVGPGVDVAARREELLDAAERAIRTAGAQTGLGEVAKQAGYARSAVYAIFPNRTALLAALSTRHAAAILDTVRRRVPEDATDRQRLKAFIDAMCEWVEAEPNLYRALGGHPFDGDGDASGLFDQLADIIEATLMANLAAQQTDPAAAGPWARAMIGAVAAAGAWWQRTRTMSRHELVEHLTLMCWEGGARLPLFAGQHQE